MAIHESSPWHDVLCRDIYLARWSRFPLEKLGKWLLLLNRLAKWVYSRLHDITAHSPFSKDYELIKLQHPNNFKICNSDDLHVKLSLLDFEIMEKHHSWIGQLVNILWVDKRVQWKLAAARYVKIEPVKGTGHYISLMGFTNKSSQISIDWPKVFCQWS